GAGAGQGQAVGAGDGGQDGQRVAGGVGDDQGSGPVVDDGRGGDRGQRGGAVAELQRAGADGGGAGVGVGAREGERAAALLGDAAGARDDPGEGVGGVAGQSHLVDAQRDGAAAGQRGDLQVQGRGRAEEGVGDADEGAAGDLDVGEHAVAAAPLVK